MKSGELLNVFDEETFLKVVTRVLYEQTTPIDTDKHSVDIAVMIIKALKEQAK